jgi:2-polyprenyl-6-methoxyphenol hydroxylase-like FAD-dependent oxidoreductase
VRKTASNGDDISSHGHDVMLLERRQFLQNLYDCLPSKESIRLGCEVQDVREYEDGVEVILSDGSIERGDIVVGADGVRSPMRSIMWDHANKRKPGSIGIEEKKSMFQELSNPFVSTQRYF